MSRNLPERKGVGIPEIELIKCAKSQREKKLWYLEDSENSCTAD